MRKKKKLSNVEIKLLLKKNLKDVVDIEKKNCIIEDPDFGQMISDEAWSSSKFIDFIKKKNTYTYTISEGELIVGFVLIEVKEKEVCIEKMIVDNNFKNSGFEEELLNFIYNKNYKDRIVFYCNENDFDTIKFLKKNEFIGKLSRDFYGLGKDAIKFVKELQ